MLIGPTNMYSRTYPISRLLVGLAIVLLQALPTALAEVPENFIVRTTIEICPEYRQAPGAIVLDVTYSIGNDPTLFFADVAGLSIDSNANTATVDVRFPTSLGTSPFHIKAFCRNAVGFSNPSNVKSISNCDRLAQFDTDSDGISDAAEDSNCSNSYDVNDASNFQSIDSDGDGIRDFAEAILGTALNDAADSPRPYIVSSAPFDPDEDGNSNPVVWRKNVGGLGYWYIRDFDVPGNHIVQQLGVPGDIPFVYQPNSGPSDVGVIRLQLPQNWFFWYFNGPGFQLTDGSALNVLAWGVKGDIIALGAWETPSVTNPAIVRLIDGNWTWWILQRNGQFRIQYWGLIGDIPKAQDLNGDGILDYAVYRPSDRKTYALLSGGGILIKEFGSPTSEVFIRGDYTGDGIEEISYWEPQTAVFKSMLSDNGFDEAKTIAQDPLHFFEIQLGLFGIHLPLNWNYQGDTLLYTVVDHATGFRFFRIDNQANGEVVALPWGIAGDYQG